ncbi:hypothetical protein PIB30_028155 [Stylosanthes scabra]|uniref:Uncharacterized protein n=1 Tax=Stylosanthes scabra TaxID=79078 RepID=A0ABU6X925_9FABA|nr:hypothetical protein [Stylosanthes scabra]
MRPSTPRPLRPTGSPSSSVSSGSSRSYHRECERSPRTLLPPPAPLHAPGPVHPVLRTLRCLFSRHRVAPPTPPSPSPPPSDDKPSVERIDSEAELEGDPEEPYPVGNVPFGAPEVYYSDVSYRSEQENASVGFGPSSHHLSDSSSGSASIGYGEASSGSASDSASDDDLVNRHFAGTFP